VNAARATFLTRDGCVNTPDVVVNLDDGGHAVNALLIEHPAN